IGGAPENAAYAELHGLLVPSGDELPTADSFLKGVRPVRKRHGIPWLRDAISRGQYSHPDGLYYGGSRIEQSTYSLQEIYLDETAESELVLTLDLHTGHGKYGTATLLSHDPVDSDGDRWLRRWLHQEDIESTTAPKVGQLAVGLQDYVPFDAEYHNATFELGTVDETRMILAERAEHWVHVHGDRDDPAHAAAVWEHRICSTPDDPEWERRAREHGRRVLDQALTAVAEH
ncbi:MAG: DUF2817 domain-containing protein, partial [Ilumatobacteraceae bacterium]